MTLCIEYTLKMRLGLVVLAKKGSSGHVKTSVVFLVVVIGTAAVIMPSVRVC